MCEVPTARLLGEWVSLHKREFCKMLLFETVIEMCYRRAVKNAYYR
jgi:hypothetical protein